MPFPPTFICNNNLLCKFLSRVWNMFIIVYRKIHYALSYRIGVETEFALCLLSLIFFFHFLPLYFVIFYLLSKSLLSDREWRGFLWNIPIPDWNSPISVADWSDTIYSIIVHHEHEQRATQVFHIFCVRAQRQVSQPGLGPRIKK